MRALSVLGLTGLLLGGCKGERKDASTDNASEAAPVADEGGPTQPTATTFTDDPCTYAMAVVDRLDIYRNVDRPLDAARAAAIVRREQNGTSVLAWLAEADRRLGRVDGGEPEDVALIEQTLAGLDAGELEDEQLRAALALIVTQLRAVALLEMRRLLAEVADGRAKGDEARVAWAEAHCLWSGGLRVLAKRADALPVRGGEGWEASIDEAFGSAGEALDDATLVQAKAAKQQIEKGMYAVAHRLILADVEGSPTAATASEALGLLDALEDRLADRNGPGLARMRQQLGGELSALDPAMFERELAVAFTKRARKYCDKAVVGAELGSPDAIAETWEGIVYTQVILPGMREALGAQGFDADGYADDWHAYLEAVEDADGDAAAAISARLVEWNCAYQDLLGIAECTSTNETTNETNETDRE